MTAGIITGERRRQGMQLLDRVERSGGLVVVFCEPPGQEPAGSKLLDKAEEDMVRRPQKGSLISSLDRRAAQSGKIP
jgi:hypothetical protein